MTTDNEKIGEMHLQFDESGLVFYYLRDHNKNQSEQISFVNGEIENSREELKGLISGFFGYESFNAGFLVKEIIEDIEQLDKYDYPVKYYKLKTREEIGFEVYKENKEFLIQVLIEGEKFGEPVSHITNPFNNNFREDNTGDLRENLAYVIEEAGLKSRKKQPYTKDGIKSLINSGWKEVDYIKSENKDNEAKKPTLEELYNQYPENIVDLANTLLEQGDTLSFLLDTWNFKHEGDRSIGCVCACAIASTFIQNTNGMHIKPNGKSGGGKSDAVEKFTLLLPPRKILDGSQSGKAPFYNPKLQKGTIIYMDDAKLNEDIVTTIKQATNKYQTETIHNTIKNQEYEQFKIPPRICWMLSSVDNFSDDQMTSRFISIDIDESHEQDKAVLENQKKMEKYGLTKETVTNDELVCRAIYDILDQEEYNILIPFIDSIRWLDTKNRRNFPMFKDILKATTLYNVKQRESFCDGFLATVDDFYRAKKIYDEIAETNFTGLDNKQRKIIYALLDAQNDDSDFETDINEIQKRAGFDRSYIVKILHGRKDNPEDDGLLGKLPGLFFEKRQVENESGIKSSKNFYWFDGYLGLDSNSEIDAFFDVVSLNTDTINQDIENFKKEYYENYYLLKNNSNITVTPVCNDCDTSVTDKNNNKSIIEERINKYIQNNNQNVITPSPQNNNNIINNSVHSKSSNNVVSQGYRGEG
ncbi:MAG: hypothetical protein ACOC5T_08710, partial [Elusimicrobiota bacterium]